MERRKSSLLALCCSCLIEIENSINVIIVAFNHQAYFKIFNKKVYFLRCLPCLLLFFITGVVSFLQASFTSVWWTFEFIRQTFFSSEPAVSKFSCFSSSENVFSPLNSWSIFAVYSFFSFSTLKMFHFLFHDFWWEICSHSNYCFSISKVLFFSFLLIFFLCL